MLHAQDEALERERARGLREHAADGAHHLLLLGQHELLLGAGAELATLQEVHQGHLEQDMQCAAQQPLVALYTYSTQLSHNTNGCFFYFISIFYR